MILDRPLRVLFAEDQEADVELLALELRRGGYAVERERVETAADFTAALDRGTWDLVICDWKMPRFDALEALAIVRERKSEVPFLVVSGIVGEETAVDALRAGARDFLSKDRLARLLPAVERELREAGVREDARRLRQQYLQAQKLEAIGQFAGGIAHDFNNLLTVITGYADLTLRSLPPDAPGRGYLGHVQEAIARSALLVRRILAVSRPQGFDVRVFDLNAVMRGMESLLQRIIPENIEFVMTLSPVLGRIRADPGHVEQILMNLVVNARDAMPGGGRLVVATGDRELASGDPRCALGLRPGPHVLLAVTDTGTGMDEATQARMFEPFFTTKGEARGSGLGLATVLAIAQQSGGRVFVRSEPGRGSCFEVLLPAVPDEIEAPAVPAPREPVPAPAGGVETILVVEDNPRIRELAVLVLRQRGYRVLEAPAPAEALVLAAAEPDEIHLLLTDMVMPGMDGMDLARKLRAARPDIRVLVVSGYSPPSQSGSGIPLPGVRYLPKPFNSDELLALVRETLDLPASGAQWKVRGGEGGPPAVLPGTPAPG